MEGNVEEGHFEYGGLVEKDDVRSYNPFMDQEGKNIDFSKYLLMNNYDKPKPKKISEEEIEKKLADKLKDSGDEEQRYSCIASQSPKSVQFSNRSSM